MWGMRVKFRYKFNADQAFFSRMNGL
uniref:Uncharacterized protein n=1 Tax=Anguilla anguilla TaxID=7936 RepID=A0A0E9P7T6_ANGAN